MSLTEKIGMFFFLLGLAIVIFSAALPTLTAFQEARLLTLAVCGILTALFNVSDREDTQMIIAGGVFIISAVMLSYVLSDIVGLNRILIALSNMAFFVASMLIVSTLMVVLKIASQNEQVSFGALARHHAKHKITLWDSTMLVAVVLVIIMLVLEFFFDTSAYADSLQYLDWIILVLFLIDLVILYKQSLGPKDFIKNNWLDVIAVIPLSSIFRVTKLARFVKIVRVLNKTRRISKVTKVNRAAKFFSERSGFNVYLKKPKTKAVKKRARKSKRK